jgi:hypothetical protein
MINIIVPMSSHIHGQETFPGSNFIPTWWSQSFVSQSGVGRTAVYPPLCKHYVSIPSLSTPPLV